MRSCIEWLRMKSFWRGESKAKICGSPQPTSLVDVWTAILLGFGTLLFGLESALL